MKKRLKRSTDTAMTFERLEARMLLSASFNVETGLLQIEGTDARDVVKLRAGSPGEVYVKAPGIAGEQLFTGVKGVKVLTYGGRDRIVVGKDIRHADSGNLMGVFVDAGQSKDTLIGGSGADTLVGNGASDRIIDRAGNNVISAGPGNDTIITGQGNDRIDAGHGNDRIVDRGGENFVDAGHGANRLNLLGTGNYFVLTGANNDVIKLKGNDNSVVDLGGNNRFVARGTGANDFITDGGNDRFVLRGGDNTVHSFGGNNVIRSTSAGLNYFVTNGGRDRIIALRGTNTVDAGRGNNRIVTGNGNDQIRTGDGRDIIIDRGGENYVDSGEGADKVRARGAALPDATDDFAAAIEANENLNTLRNDPDFKAPTSLRDELARLHNGLDVIFDEPENFPLPLGFGTSTAHYLLSINETLTKLINDGPSVTQLMFAQALAEALNNQIAPWVGEDIATSPLPASLDDLVEDIYFYAEPLLGYADDVIEIVERFVRDVSTISNTVVNTSLDLVTTVQTGVINILQELVGGSPIASELVGQIDGLLTGLVTTLRSVAGELGDITNDPATLITIANQVIQDASSVIPPELLATVEQTLATAQNYIDGINPGDPDSLLDAVIHLVNDVVVLVETLVNEGLVPEVVGLLEGTVLTLEHVLAQVTEDDLSLPLVL